MSRAVAGRSRCAATDTAAIFPDELFDHASFMADGKPLGRVSARLAKRSRVAVVGAGIAGLCAAHELGRAGVETTIFEAGDIVGGRMLSKHFTNRDGSPADCFAELGAMRVPTSSGMFFHYADKFGIRCAPFPNPLAVPTLIQSRNHSHFCRDARDLPRDFARIKNAWEGYMDLLLDPVREARATSDSRRLEELWQRYIRRFKDVSFYDVIYDILPWGKDDIDRFGALGLGTGGFSPLYTVSFVEIIRILIGQLEVDQQLIVRGMSSFAQAFLDAPVVGGAPLREFCELRLRAKVESISSGPRGVALVTADGAAHTGFAAAIVTPNLPVLEAMGLTQAGRRRRPLLSAGERVALRKLHHISSSKLFIRTRRKFWLDARGSPLAGMPQVVMSDEAPRATYLLDYPQTDSGVVCVSYTWDDDSVKFAGLAEPDRLRIFTGSLAKAHPALARELRPVNGEIITVDWQNDPLFLGAFKLNQPGQEDDCAAVYWQHLSCLDKSRDSGVYLAGDAVSWHGGWAEGALRTAINAACAVLWRIGGKVRKGSPLEVRPRFEYR